MDKTRIEHFKETELLEHPVEHWHIASARCHLIDATRDPKKRVQFSESVPMQSVDIDVRNLLENHLLESLLESFLRWLSFEWAAPDADIL